MLFRSIAETKVTVVCEELQQSMGMPEEITAVDLKEVLHGMLKECQWQLPESVEDYEHIIPAILPQIEARIPGIFDCPEELAKSFREKTYDRESALAEILEYKKILDDFEVPKDATASISFEKAFNSPEKLTDAELEMLIRITNHSVKSLETQLPTTE